MTVSVRLFCYPKFNILLHVIAVKTFIFSYFSKNLIHVQKQIMFGLHQNAGTVMLASYLVARSISVHVAIIILLWLFLINIKNTHALYTFKVKMCSSYTTMFVYLSLKRYATVGSCVNCQYHQQHPLPGSQLSTYQVICCSFCYR